MENNGRSPLKVKQLKQLAMNTKPGDKENKEALAARIYFKTLYGSQFKRGRYEDKINSALNYGYAIIRSFIKIELAYHGFELSFGIKHSSSENPFNLSDDIIEVYRPFVDDLVFNLVFIQNIKFFDINEKKFMLNILYDKCVIDNKTMSLLDAIKLTINSVVQCYESNSPSQLILPQVIEVGN